MRTYLFKILFLLTLPFCLQAHTIKDQLMKAQPGDYIVSEQGSIRTLLLVRKVASSSIQLEEVSAPVSKIKTVTSSWKTWLENHAPGHTSWTIYTIDFGDEKVSESYSRSQQEELYCDDSDYLFAKLLSLPLQEVPSHSRKRIGAPPKDTELDTRVMWNPELVIGGEKIKKPVFTVYKAKWPSDHSDLSQCSFEFYFDAARPNFPFPYWLEISNGHYTLKLRILDSGSGLFYSEAE